MRDVADQRPPRTLGLTTLRSRASQETPHHPPAAFCKRDRLVSRVQGQKVPLVILTRDQGIVLTGLCSGKFRANRVVFIVGSNGDPSVAKPGPQGDIYGAMTMLIVVK